MSRLLLCDVRGPVEDLLQKLSGEDGNKWFGALKKMLRRQNPWEGNGDLALNWAKAYEALGMSAEYAEFGSKFGQWQTKDEWPVPVLKGATCNKVVVALRRLGVNVYTYVDDLDKNVTVNDRDPDRDGSYAVSVKAIVEADEENKNKSAEMLAEEGHKGMTLLERLLLELAYFLTTRKHLDVKNITLCAGSRHSHGCVPKVNWRPDYRKVYVVWSSLGNRYDNLRSRSVFSLPAKTRESVA